MLHVDELGHVDAERIIVKIFSKIQHGRMDKVNGLVVHQTDSPTASSTFNSYQNANANGAHFLIDKDGTIYQTASLYKMTWHVGYLQSRCLLTKKCAPTEFKTMDVLERSLGHTLKVHQRETQKVFPDRFPDNTDSIGVEIVGESKKIYDIKTGKGKDVYESVTSQKNDALKWLVKELVETLSVSMNEIYRHPEIGRKNDTEASSATW